MTRHGKAGGGGSRGGGELRGRWGPGARAGSGLEILSGCGGRFGQLTAAQHGDPRQVSRALDATASQCPAGGLAAQGRGGVGGSTTGTSSLPWVPFSGCCPRTCRELGTCSLPRCRLTAPGGFGAVKPLPSTSSLRTPFLFVALAKDPLRRNVAWLLVLNITVMPKSCDFKISSDAAAWGGD